MTKQKGGKLGKHQLRVVHIPAFHGKSNPEVYLEWEKKVELIFDCRNYSKEKKVKLAAVDSIDYAIV